jgi:hypothetical protein
VNIELCRTSTFQRLTRMRKSSRGCYDRGGAFRSPGGLNSIVRCTLVCYRATKPARFELLLCAASEVGRKNVRKQSRECSPTEAGPPRRMRSSLYVYILEGKSRCCKCGEIVVEVAGATVRLAQRAEERLLECKWRVERDLYTGGGEPARTAPWHAKLTRLQRSSAPAGRAFARSRDVSCRFT